MTRIMFRHFELHSITAIGLVLESKGWDSTPPPCGIRVFHAWNDKKKLKINILHYPSSRSLLQSINQSINQSISQSISLFFHE